MIDQNNQVLINKFVPIIGWLFINAWKLCFFGAFVVQGDYCSTLIDPIYSYIWLRPIVHAAGTPPPPPKKEVAIEF